MPATSLLEASSTFEDFHVPRFQITAGGRQVPAGVLRDVVQVTYNDSTTELDSFEFTINNWDDAQREFKYVGAERRAMLAGATEEERLQKLFEPGAAEFELRFGYGGTLAVVSTGATTTLEPAFPAGAAPTLTVRALNVLFKLRREQYRDHWRDKTISQVVEDIGRRTGADGARRFPLPIRTDATARAAETPLDYIAQDNQYDIDFLLQEARKVGYVVYVDLEPQGRGRRPREVLHFGPPNARNPGVPAVTYALRRGISLIDFTPKLSIANQVGWVEVRAMDRVANRAIRKRVGLDHPSVRTNRDLHHLLRVDGGATRGHVVTNEPQYTPRQAERRAAAVLSERLSQMVEATGTTIGLPDLRAGRRIEISGVGARFSGTWFVTKTTHTLNDSGYMTRFTARREHNDTGLT